LENHLRQFLRPTSVIDFEDASVQALSAEFAREAAPSKVAARCFKWVRDNIRHSIDHGDRRVTIAASDVLRHGTGLCYAKSHLLAALLRANGIPCGLVYQRVAADEHGTSFCLHGLNAVWLAEHGWYRADPRGNRAGIATSFAPPKEHLAFATTMPGEGLINQVFSDPLPIVLSVLRQHDNLADLCRNLPDWNAEQCL
jgi:transglutaminase-like putative cysteine protease